MTRRLSLYCLQASLCALALLATTKGRAGDLGAPASASKVAQEVPADSEFWELYDELADDSGHLPAPEEIPPPKESLMPNAASSLDTAKEEL